MDNPAKLQSLQNLAQTSQEILQQISPLHPDAHAIYSSSSSSSKGIEDRMISTDLRALFQKTRAAYSKQGSAEFEAQLRKIVQSSYSSNNSNNSNDDNDNNGNRIRRKMERFSRSNQVSIMSLLQNVMTRNHEHGDKDHRHSETEQIVHLVRTLSETTNKVNFTIFRETTIAQEDNDSSGTNGKTVRYICIVHVLFDQVFRTYERKRDRGEMPLFRGFSLELVPGDDDDVSSSQGSLSSVESKNFAFQNSIDENQETLMLKMKFLPYMVRLWFICQSHVMFSYDVCSLLFIMYQGTHVWMP
jgi:hypothetical protein